MDPINVIIPINLQLNDDCEKNLEEIKQQVKLTYKNAIVYIINLFSKDSFLKYLNFKHEFDSKFNDDFPLIAAAVNKMTAKIFLILKNEGTKATFIEWDCNDEKEVFSSELVGLRIYDGMLYQSAPEIGIILGDSYLQISKKHYEIEWKESGIIEVEILYDINLNPITDDGVYLPPFTCEIYQKHPDQTNHRTSIERHLGGLIFEEKEFYGERITTSCNQALIQPEDFEFIRTSLQKRKSPYKNI